MRKEEMTKNRNILTNENKGLFQDLIQRARLILRLMGDKRVNFLLKLLPVGVVVYLVLPFDLIPEIALPVIGLLDDAFILWFGMTLFVSLCPDEIVKEHTDALQKVIPATWRDAPQGEVEEIIDVEAKNTDREGQ
jgi:uncharacterized membrane protein YkvA (DUF1232 family)